MTPSKNQNEPGAWECGQEVKIENPTSFDTPIGASIPEAKQCAKSSGPGVVATKPDDYSFLEDYSTAELVRYTSTHELPKSAQAKVMELLFAPMMGKAENYAEFMPLLFNISQRDRFALEDYKPFRPVYDYDIPDTLLLRTARQCSKSTNLAYKSLSLMACTPGYKQLYVTPLFEQARRFSHNYVKQAMMNSNIRDDIMDSTCESNVLQKTLTNGAMLFFTYCYRDVDRARGIASDGLTIDEIQDIDISFIPIIRECMAASKLWGNTTFAGTPKTLDNTICGLWGKSSQGEWVIPCRSCRHENISCIAEDLLEMIGPRGLICAKCGYKLETREGFYLHKFPDRLGRNMGLHVPQPVLPLHCERPRAWKQLLQKMKDYRQALLYNEVFGEDCDAGVKLISLEKIKQASVLHPNTFEHAVAFSKRMRHVCRVLGVDWGGRGEDGDSFTAIIILGLRVDGTFDVMYGERVPPTVTDDQEVNIISKYMKAFKCNYLAHDYRGQGTVKQTQLIKRGWGKKTMCWQNETSMAKYFAKKSKNQVGQRYISINRSAGLTLLASQFNADQFRLPFFPEVSENSVFIDLNSWFENTVARPDGRDVYQVMRSASQPDDAGMAILYAACTAWLMARKWPRYVSAAGGIIED